jgi:hypothetical protein
MATVSRNGSESKYRKFHKGEAGARAGKGAGGNGKAGASANGEPGYARVFEWFGLTFRKAGSQLEAESCPFCDKDRFHLDPATGLYHCKHCQEGGNVKTFLTKMHQRFLGQTTDAHYRALGGKRGGIALQTLRRHELAYDAAEGRWLLPFKSPGGSVVNVQLYYPGRPKGHNKMNLPGLPACLFNFHELSTDRDRPVLLFEGVFDLIAADYHLRQNRSKYDLIAAPVSFKEEWVPYLKGRKVMALYDNDKGGDQHRDRVRKLLGESGEAAELLVLKWPDGTPDGYDVNDWVRDHPKAGLTGFVRGHSVRIVRQPRLDWKYGWQRTSTGPEVIDWVWPNRLRCGTYASLSGARNTLKSTLVRELVARYTRGEALPGCEAPGLPPGHVIYITAEDGLETAWAALEHAGADFDRLIVLPGVLKSGEPMNVLEDLEELRQKVREFGVRFVVIDGQNSVVGAPCIATDILARHSLTNPLHQFAQQENLCLLGVRNEDPTGRAYGPASMNDLGRCILRAVELDPKGGERYFELRFERISDAPPKTHPTLPYSVADHGGPARGILWGKVRPRDPGRARAAKDRDQAAMIAADLSSPEGKARVLARIAADRAAARKAGKA